MSSHVFSLLFKVLLNSTLSWWKTICFVGLVLLGLNAGLGKHWSLCMGASETRSSWGGRRRDWSTQQQWGFHCWEVVISPAEWRNAWLAGRCWGRGVTGLALHQLHKHPVGKLGLYLWSIFRPCKSSSQSPLLKSYFGLFFPTSCFLSLLSNWSTFPRSCNLISCLLCLLWFSQLCNHTFN